MQINIFDGYAIYAIKDNNPAKETEGDAASAPAETVVGGVMQ